MRGSRITDNRPTQIISRARAEGRSVLDEPSAKQLLAAYGISVPRSELVKAGSELGLVGMSGPFVAKLVSQDVVHKSEVGGVRLGLADRAAVHAAASELIALAHKIGVRLDAVLVEETVGGIELVVGGVIDPCFGPVVMLGLGGIFVEVLRDTVFRVSPITPRDARDMIDDLRGVSILRGARGTKPVDENAVVAVLLALGGQDGLLVEHESDILEVDLNPLIVSETGAKACDARIVLAPA